MSSVTLRRQRGAAPAFASPRVSPLLNPAATSWSRSNTTDPSPRSPPIRPIEPSSPVAVKTRIKRTATNTSGRTRSSRHAVSNPLRRVTSRPSQLSCYSQPVPDALPHEIVQPTRGRNARRRVREAEHFRRYLYLRRQLKPWSDAFRAEHGRTPSLIDVHASDIPGLLDRFVEYLEALQGLRFDVQKIDL